MSRWGDDGEHRVASAKTLATVLHLQRGTPYVYQGEELGMTNAHYTSVGSTADIESVNWARDALDRGVPQEQVVRSLAAKSRDNARTPMQWDASEHAGFTTGTPWLPANPNHDDDQRRGRRGRPGLGLPPLPHGSSSCGTAPGRRATATTGCCCPTTSRSSPTSGRWTASGSWSP